MLTLSVPTTLSQRSTPPLLLTYHIDTLCLFMPSKYLQEGRFRKTTNLVSSHCFSSAVTPLAQPLSCLSLSHPKLHYFHRTTFFAHVANPHGKIQYPWWCNSSYVFLSLLIRITRIGKRGIEMSESGVIARLLVAN